MWPQRGVRPLAGEGFPSIFMAGMAGEDLETLRGSGVLDPADRRQHESHMQELAPVEHQRRPGELLSSSTSM